MENYPERLAKEFQSTFACSFGSKKTLASSDYKVAKIAIP